MEHHLSEDCTPLLGNVLSRLRGVRKARTGWVACCPAHDDQRPSLSIGLGKEGQILLHCHAGCTIEAIVGQLGLVMTDLFPSSLSASARPRIPRQGLSLLDFAQDKWLHWRFLLSQGIIEKPGGGLVIQYYNMDGTLAPRHRIRTALVAKDGSWWTKGSGDIVPYGLESLSAVGSDGSLILVEGETDRLTLLFHGYHALGIPGAEMVKTTLHACYLEGINKVYIVQEPDLAGQHFAHDIIERLTTWAWHGTAYVVVLSGAKDPNELHKKDAKGFKAAFQQALDQAKQVYSAQASDATSTNEVTPARIDLTQPFTLQHLLTVPFSPSRWAVKDLLPEGLLLLAGKPKQGKSWLALQIAHAVVSGSTVLGIHPTNRGDVLYLALEDTPQRLQIRNKQVLSTLKTVPQGLEFALQWPHLDEGGLAQLETYAQAHPQLRLIIIDTWAKLAPVTPARARTQYEMEYAALAPLKQLADTYHLSLLTIHHLRKSSGQDVLDEITGSTGLVGAVDGILLLKRTREQEAATLLVTGRDLPEQLLSLTFDSTTALWTSEDKSEGSVS